MRIAKHLLTIALLGMVLAACQAQKPIELSSPHNFNTLSDRLVTGGQPSREELQQLKRSGVTQVINLRGLDEDIPFDEEAEAQALGLKYVSLPISGAADITVENAKKLHALLASDERVFLHCSSGNRAGALLAIGAHEIEGKPIDEALRIGRAAGLSSLEGRVKSVLD